MGEEVVQDGIDIVGGQYEQVEIRCFLSGFCGFRWGDEVVVIVDIGEIVQSGLTN